MKLTYRDKVLLISVLVVLVWAIGIFLIIKPAFSTMTETSASYETKQSDLTILKNQAETEQGLPDKLKKDYDSAIEVAAYFYPNENKEVATDRVRELFETSTRTIKNTEYSIDDYSSKAITTYSLSSTNSSTGTLDTLVNDYENAGSAAADDSTDASADPTQMSNTVGCYSITSDFTCSLSDLQDFADDLMANDHKSFIIDSCTIDDVNESTVTGTVTFSYYMAPTVPDPFAEDTVAADTEAE